MSAHSHRPIRVLHLGNPVGLYGAERWILALVKYLPQARVISTVGVIQDTPGGAAPLCEAAAKAGFRTQTFTAYGKLSWAAVRQIRDFIRTEGIDIVHSHGYKTDLLGRMATIGTRCRNVATPHGWSVGAGVALRVYEFLDRLSFACMDAVVPLSEDLHQGLRKVPGVARKLSLIPNGVDLAEIDAIDGVADPVRSWRQNGDLIIGYVGQLITRKGVATLIRAFHQLPIGNKRLCLVGSGPQRAECERLTYQLGEAERIAFLGYREDRIALMRGFDVFVLPSMLEGIPRCLMEAMSCGIPCVATDIPGCRDLIQPGDTGLLFPFGNVDALQRVLEAIAINASDRQRIGVAARAKIRHEYSAGRMADHYSNLYERVRVA